MELWCDECGVLIRRRDGTPVSDVVMLSRLPFDTQSAGKGESGTLCYPCYARLMDEVG